MISIRRSWQRMPAAKTPVLFAPVFSLSQAPVVSLRRFLLFECCFLLSHLELKLFFILKSVKLRHCGHFVAATLITACCKPLDGVFCNDQLVIMAGPFVAHFLMSKTKVYDKGRYY